jgi:hypothetical protein
MKWRVGTLSRVNRDGESIRPSGRMASERPIAIIETRDRQPAPSEGLRVFFRQFWTESGSSA